MEKLNTSTNALFATPLHEIIFKRALLQILEMFTVEQHLHLVVIHIKFDLCEVMAKLVKIQTALEIQITILDH